MTLLELLDDYIVAIANALKVPFEELDFYGGKPGKKLYPMEETTLDCIQDDGGLNVFLMNIKSNFLIASFNLSELRGCCGICLLSSFFVDKKYRGSKVGKILGGLQKDLARYDGYSVLLCTDVADNIPQKKILGRYGWRDLFRFQNKRTDNYVDISVVSLNDANPGWSLDGILSSPLSWWNSLFSKRPISDRMTVKPGKYR